MTGRDPTPPGPVDEAFRAATAAWTAILDQVDGMTVDSRASAAAVSWAVHNALAELTPRQIRTFAMLVASNLLAAGEFVNADPRFLRHLLEQTVRIPVSPEDPE